VLLVLDTGGKHLHLQDVFYSTADVKHAIETVLFQIVHFDFPAIVKRKCQIVPILRYRYIEMWLIRYVFLKKIMNVIFSLAINANFLPPLVIKRYSLYEGHSIRFIF
jgi:hypothetical protein